MEGFEMTQREHDLTILAADLLAFINLLHPDLEMTDEDYFKKLQFFSVKAASLGVDDYIAKHGPIIRKPIEEAISKHFGSVEFAIELFFEETGVLPIDQKKETLFEWMKQESPDLSWDDFVERWQSMTISADTGHVVGYIPE